MKEFSPKGSEREREDGGKSEGKLSIYKRLSIPSTLFYIVNFIEAFLINPRNW